jgi:hypothetical protein
MLSLDFGDQLEGGGDLGKTLGFSHLGELGIELRPFLVLAHGGGLQVFGGCPQFPGRIRGSDFDIARVASSFSAEFASLAHFMQRTIARKDFNIGLEDLAQSRCLRLITSPATQWELSAAKQRLPSP